MSIWVVKTFPQSFTEEDVDLPAKITPWVVFEREGEWVLGGAGGLTFTTWEEARRWVETAARSENPPVGIEGAWIECRSDTSEEARQYHLKLARSEVALDPLARAVLEAPDGITA